MNSRLWSLVAIAVSTIPAAAQYNQPRPAVKEECPQGREIRAKKQYPSSWTDCQVLDEDTRLENGRSGPRPLTPRRQPPPVVASPSPPIETPEQKRQKQVDFDKNLGYETISVEDFILDSKQLALSGNKIVIEGYYRKLGNIEALYSTQTAANEAERINNVTHVDLLTDDAARNLRAYFLKCGPGRDMLGCWTRIRGHAETCKLTIFGTSVPKACLVAETGWFLND